MLDRASTSQYVAIGQEYRAVILTVLKVGEDQSYFPSIKLFSLEVNFILTKMFSNKYFT